MRIFYSILVWVFLLSGFWVQPALAAQNVSCVQEQLLEEGLDAGSADGILGRKTTSALSALQKKIPDLQKLPPISVANASVYCRSIGVARGSKIGWTSNEGFVRLTVGDAVSVTAKSNISNIVMEMEAFYRDELNVVLPQAIDVIISSSVDQVGSFAVAALREQGEHSDVSERFRNWCRGYRYCAKSYGGVVAVGFSDERGFPVSDIREVIAHEFAHEIQAQYVGNFRARGAERRIRARGPKWLTEALAGALGMKFRQPNLEIKYQLKNLNSRRQYTPDRLESLREQNASAQDDFHDYSTFAGLLLASQTSYGSFIEFWEKTPQLGWERAFSSAFGMSVNEFYASFGNLE